MVSRLINFFLLICSLGVVTIWGLNDATFFFILFTLILFVVSDQLVSKGDAKRGRVVSPSKQIAILDAKRELLKQLLKVRLEGLSRVVNSPIYRGEIEVDRRFRGGQFLEFTHKLMGLVESGWSVRVGYPDLKTTVRLLFNKFYVDRYLMSQQVKAKAGCVVLKLINKETGRVVFKRAFFGFSFGGSSGSVVQS